MLRVPNLFWDIVLIERAYFRYATEFMAAATYEEALAAMPSYLSSPRDINGITALAFMSTSLNCAVCNKPPSRFCVRKNGNHVPMNQCHLDRKRRAKAAEAWYSTPPAKSVLRS